MSDWRHTATRCAVVGCERQRVKGWSTCSLTRHYRAGMQLAGSGATGDRPIELDPPGTITVDMNVLEERLIEHYRGGAPGRASDLRSLRLHGRVDSACRNCGGVDGCFPGCTDHD